MQNKSAYCMFAKFCRLQLPIFKQSGRKGFTLAEVLITLGVIGVVAAMTLPTVIANYQKKVLVTQLKKEVSVIENYFKKVVADEGVDKIYQTSVFKYVSYVPANSMHSMYIVDIEKFANYFNLDFMPKTSKFCTKLGSGGSTCNEKTVLRNRDGSCFAFEHSDFLNIELLFMDVNCDKGPNKPGYDRFTWQVGSEAQPADRLIFSGGTFTFTEDAIDEFKEAMKQIKSTSENDLSSDVWFIYGINALAYLMSNGWEMDY